MLLLAPTLFFGCKTRTAEGKGESEAVKFGMADGSAEFAEEKYIETVRRHDIMFQNGNVEGWTKMFADDAVLYYSGGDSLVGKKAITDFWTNRRNTLVASVKHTNEVFMPVKVNKPQSIYDVAGVWVLHWMDYTTNYKSGQSVQGSIHADYHFNDDNLVDRMIIYQDMAPTLAVTGEKKYGAR